MKKPPVCADATGGTRNRRHALRARSTYPLDSENTMDEQQHIERLEAELEELREKQERDYRAIRYLLRPKPPVWRRIGSALIERLLGLGSMLQGAH